MRIDSQLKLPRGGSLPSIKEYAEAIKVRYRKATKEEKGRILDEFAKASRLHSKAAIRLLNCCKPLLGKRRSWTTKVVRFVVIEALRDLWEASDRFCAKRLKPFLPEYKSVMRRCGESKMSIETERHLWHMSAATIDRLLRPWKQKGGRRSFSTAKEGSLLRSAIPIRTFAD